MRVIHILHENPEWLPPLREALEEQGIRCPITIAAVGRKALLQAAESLARIPFILKPNRGGKGLGVSLFSRQGTGPNQTEW